FNPRPNTVSEIDFKNSQIENLQASLACLNNSLIHLQQHISAKDEQINKLREENKEKGKAREDHTWSLLGLFGKVVKVGG
ncbi:MAG: hypothetical protein Q8Q91_02285, partial [Candidatus Daviesbacteria bacterium]|nr:hypothetical protein [Candidatus Daviesbacteria bacterium]